MNTSRTNFNMPLDHQVKITPYWFLGLLEGEGSFYLNRNPIRPLLEKTKEYLENNLGFDKYSLVKINNSSVISVSSKKAVGNSKPTVTLDIRNLRILQNYFVPYLNKLNFLSKKYLDFSDFKIICQTAYNGAHKNNIIQDLMVKLSLSTTGLEDKLSYYF